MKSRKPHTVEGVSDRGKVNFAREQRREPTPGERLLWQHLRRGQLGVKFRRQHPIEDFVLDFYCAEVRLAIELDGASHEGREGYDRWRDGVLALWDIRVIRFSERTVANDLPRVLTQIRRAIEEAEG